MSRVDVKRVSFCFEVAFMSREQNKKGVRLGEHPFSLGTTEMYFDEVCGIQSLVINYRDGSRPMQRIVPIYNISGFTPTTPHGDINFSAAVATPAREVIPSQTVGARTRHGKTEALKEEAG